MSFSSGWATGTCPLLGVWRLVRQRQTHDALDGAAVPVKISAVAGSLARSWAVLWSALRWVTSAPRLRRSRTVLTLPAPEAIVSGVSLSCFRHAYTRTSVYYALLLHLLNLMMPNLVECVDVSTLARQELHHVVLSEARGQVCACRVRCVL